MKELSLKDLLDETKATLKALEKKKCRKCKQIKELYESGFCKPCWIETSEKKKAKRESARNVHGSGNVYVYDEEGNSVLEHRYVMEKHLGRKLQEGEIVLRRDGNKANNILSNLMLGFKNGTPFDRIICNNCETRGDFYIATEE